MLAIATTLVPAGLNLIKDSKKALRAMCPQSVLNWRERMFYGRYGEVELHLVEFLCRPGQDSIDIGANDGCYIHFMRPFSRNVLAFEPLPWLAEALMHKFSDDSKVIVREVALSDVEGTATLHIPLVNDVAVTGCSTVSKRASATYPATRTIGIATRRLDDFHEQSVGFIKIDVEGHEELVLQGATRTITTNRPRLLVELVERLCPGAVGRVVNLMDGLGYRGFFIYQGELLPAQSFDPEAMQNDKYYPDLTASLHARQRFGKYVYNFIFVPQEEATAVSASIRERVAEL